MNKKSVVKPSGIGGQAVLEGVMMKIKTDMPLPSENLTERLR